MASIQKGGSLGVVWSLEADISGTGVGTNTPQSLDYSLESSEKEIMDSDGLTKCLVLYNQRETITLEVVPSGTTIALARAANVLPAIGADITLTDTNDVELHNSTWIFMGGSKRKTIDGEVRLTFNLRKYETALSTIT